MVRGFFLRQVAHGARLPVHDGDIGGGSGLRFVREGDGLAVARPDGAGFGNFGRVGEVLHLAAVAGDGEEVVNFAAALIGLKDDPFSVWRPGGAGLPIVRLAQLDGPAARGAYFPQIVAARKVGAEDDLLAVGRPGAAAHRARVKKIVHGDGYGAYGGVEATDFGSVISRVSGESEAARTVMENTSSNASRLNFTRYLLGKRIAAS